MKKAFTIIEVILVIVIFGIVATIGTDIIVNLYSNYLRTKVINKLESQTEVTIEQIAKRLSNSIKSTRGFIKNGTNQVVDLLDGDTDSKVLIWLGKSESGIGGNVPLNPPANSRGYTRGYSGFIDLNHADTKIISGKISTIKTTGSDLNFANHIVEALTEGKVDFSGTKKSPVLVSDIYMSDISSLKDFITRSSDLNISKYYTNSSDDYTIKVGKDKKDVFKVIGSDNAFKFSNNKRYLFNQYDLSHSAYAIVKTGNVSDDFNLTLHYNFQPWHGEKYNDKNTKKIVLAEHVSTFQIFSDYDKQTLYLNIKLCMKDVTTSDTNISICKETVVF